MTVLLVIVGLILVIWVLSDNGGDDNNHGW